MPDGWSRSSGRRSRRQPERAPEAALDQSSVMSRPQEHSAPRARPARSGGPRDAHVDAVKSPAGTRPPTIPPPWLVHTAWRVHRALYRLSGGRFLWTTSNKRGWGALRLTTIGRKSGQERSVILGYLEDGPDVVTLAMNGWAAVDPQLDAFAGRRSTQTPMVILEPRDETV
jgi:hypothetical protein